MPSRRPHVAASAAQSTLAQALAALRTRLELPTAFPPDVLAEADAAVAGNPLPELDLTSVEFVTIDPPDSSDLDQAVHIEAHGERYRVRYAIADVPAFVAPGGAIDIEARKRGQSMYAADGTITLHPPAIGNDAASLLPQQLRGAFVWDFELDAHGRVLSVSLRRARVRSRAKLSYAEAQSSIDDGTASDSLQLLKRVGLARVALERERGGASLNAPDEEIVMHDGAYTLERRVPLPVEDWNAQISLMTGMAAAELMIEGRVGILRIMPKPSDDSVDTFRAQTEALGMPWSTTMAYGEYLRSLENSEPQALAILQAATGLFRGAGYVVMNGNVPAETQQSAIAAPYAHATAPLRRLVDRWSLVICEALANEADVPAWARESLVGLPEIMAASSRRASQLNAASVDRVEAALLTARLGQVFDATVIVVRGEKTIVQLHDPTVTASVGGAADVTAGSVVSVRLDSVDIAAGSVGFTVV